MSIENNVLPLKITLSEHSKLIAETTVGKDDHAPQRLIKKLLQIYPGTLPTLQINSECAIGNISDVATTVNRKIIKHKFFIACQKPITPFKNRFGQTSQMHLWGLHRLPTAANDPFYDPAGE